MCSHWVGAEKWRFLSGHHRQRSKVHIKGKGVRRGCYGCSNPPLDPKNFERGWMLGGKPPLPFVSEELLIFFACLLACQRGCWCTCTMDTTTPCLENRPKIFEEGKEKPPPPPSDFFRPAWCSIDYGMHAMLNPKPLPPPPPFEKYATVQRSMNLHISGIFMNLRHLLLRQLLP